jgi:hypothetical protein
MRYAWGSFWERSRKSLKIGWLITAAAVALYVGWVRPINRGRGIAESRATGLAAFAGKGGVAWDPISLWQSRSLQAKSVDNGIVGGVLGGVPMQMATLIAPQESPAAPPPSPDSEDRKMVRTGAIDLVVKSPAQAADALRMLAERLGGFLVSSQVSGGADAVSGTVAFRVPAARFEEARNEIRKLGLRVEGERIEAQDVTRQYVDREARLRNLRAQEMQYLSILREAHTVKDTLEVSGKLDEVRGAIEQGQAEFEALSKQIETVALTVTLRAEAEAQVFGLNWRPLYQLKIAARGGLDGLADYVASMTSFLFYLPTIVLWLATILAGAASGWRVLRWGARRFFRWHSPAKQAV